ncbi:MAG: hypothetical protein IJ861_01905 [Clostridia bacterium]|nr:hypothetical protein [Clostridia bacterium]
MKRKLNCNLALFSIGGISYGLIEIIWRKYTHWTMVLTGGFCFVVLYRIFKRLVGIAMWKKCMIGSSVITSVEFVVGCAVNLKAKMNVWDYSGLPFNFKGQICLIYSILWAALTVPISGVCSLLRKRFDF